LYVTDRKKKRERKRERGEGNVINYKPTANASLKIFHWAIHDVGPISASRFQQTRNTTNTNTHARARARVYLNNPSVTRYFRVHTSRLRWYVAALS